LCVGRNDLLPLHGAAIELGILGIIASLSIDDAPRPSPDGIDWPNKLAVMASDFLLTQALKTATAAGDDMPTLLNGWLERVCRARTATLSDPTPTAIDSLVTRLYEGAVVLPITVGAGDTPVELSGLASGLARAVRLSDDIRMIKGRRSRIGTSLDFAMRKKISTATSGLGVQDLELEVESAIRTATWQIPTTWENDYRVVFTSLLKSIRADTEAQPACDAPVVSAPQTVR
jgi:hypothetical protein